MHLPERHCLLSPSARPGRRAESHKQTWKEKAQPYCSGLDEDEDGQDWIEGGDNSEDVSVTICCMCKPLLRNILSQWFQ